MPIALLYTLLIKVSGYSRFKEWEESEPIPGYFPKPMLFLLAFYGTESRQTHSRVAVSVVQDSHHRVHEDTLTESNCTFYSHPDFYHHPHFANFLVL